ncbi:AbrB/MazE/SpoVT family DNA-binding domain-containing protein [Fundicoccus culcitae]|uniref:AbrB/MazE/SpoVT family DNA-binding domain-containing protein n=1 Tax=Fundicoccus culcitae TaxID=2969821 RepID=A0ABY5P980_9LACT|nr:AbrB/MazE/SpoVT family DNA-binding domain-containing protein [Fundicoccus culcitae]UUX35146.1 AbrB/MazE/SpoVT family DNA-binding domain-containing protein [Fundicoccus culcitae]
MDKTKETVELRKWGNSNAILIPNSLIKKYNLKAGDSLDIIEEESTLMIKTEKRPDTTHIDIAERIINKNLDVFLRLKDK